MRQVESLKNEQEKTTELEAKVKEVVKERDSLNRQLSQSLPQVSEPYVNLDFRPHERGDSAWTCRKVLRLCIAFSPSPETVRIS